MLLPRHRPPAFMSDFDAIPGQLAQWGHAVSGWIQESITSELEVFRDAGLQQPCQFFDAAGTDVPGPSIDQEIVWNAFPRTLRLGFGQQPAYPIADSLFSLGDPSRPGLPTAPPFFVGPIWKSMRYRPLDEYCEWRVERAPDTGKIDRITFTSEPPEYWQALHGDTLAGVGPSLQGGATPFLYPFTGNPGLLLELYRRFVSPHVQYDDLICHQDYVDLSDGTPQVVYQKGGYNPFNKWNTTHGIMHLCHPNNTISAEIKLAADATVLRHREIKGAAPRPVVVPDVLVCCAGYGGTARSSDPTIGGAVNALARAGAWITLSDPIGLYMNDLNTQGWEKPNGTEIDPNEYFTVVRGVAGGDFPMIERAVLEVPPEQGFTVSDITIAGVPIRYGGQVAEHINVKIVGQVRGLGAFSNKSVACSSRCAIRKDGQGPLTRPYGLDDPTPDGYVEAYGFDQGTYWQASPQEAT